MFETLNEKTNNKSQQPANGVTFPQINSNKSSKTTMTLLQTLCLIFRSLPPPAIILQFNTHVGIHV